MLLNRTRGRSKSSGTKPIEAPENRLLASLQPDEYERLQPMLETVQLRRKFVMHKQGTPVKSVFFPSGGMCSLVHTMEDGRGIEVGSVGAEGLVNISALFGSAPQHYESIVQVEVPGMTAQVMSADDFRREAKNSAGFQDMALRYAQVFLTFSMQCTACNGLHSVEERCARWLLMSHDRADSDTFQLTQEFLSIMLGVRRASVTLTLGAFQRAGLIEHRSKMITVRSRAGLIETACECYEIVQSFYRKVLPASSAYEPVPLGRGRGR